jgi:phosphate ABC transporter permease protein PstC
MALDDAALAGAVIPPKRAEGNALQPSFDLHTPAARDGEWLIRPILLLAALCSGLVVTLVVAFVFWRAWPLWHVEGLKFLTTSGWDSQLENAWNSGGVTFGALSLVVGTVLTTVGSVLVAGVIGTGAAVFLAELAPKWLRGPVEAVVQLMAGIPSVVYGLVGLAVVVPYIMNNMIPDNAAQVLPDIPLDGTCLLAGIIVLSFMILPFFVSVALDALRAVPRSYMDGGMALGMTRWRAITTLQIPAATPGLVAGIVLASSRAVGEAIALSMVAGSLAMVPEFNHGVLYTVLQPIRTMASAIVDTGADASDVPAIASAMFALASVLLVVSLGLSLTSRWAFKLFNMRTNVVSERRV